MYTKFAVATVMKVNPKHTQAKTRKYYVGYLHKFMLTQSLECRCACGTRCAITADAAHAECHVLFIFIAILKAERQTRTVSASITSNQEHVANMSLGAL